MILKAFSLLDQKVGTFSPPFFVAHIGQAIRMVTEVGQDLNTTVGRYPSDFALCEVGTFDDTAGMFEPMIPVHHGLVLGFLPNRQAELPQLFPVDRGNGVQPHSEERA